MSRHPAPLAADINILLNAARISDPPDDVADQVRALTQQATALLKEHAWSGPYAVEQLRPPGDGMLVWHPADLRRTIPYSPFLGELNPAAGQAKVWADGDAVRGAVTMSPIHAGPIDSVHGGVVAALLDELTSLAVMAAGAVGYTRELRVSYRRPTPLGTGLELWARTAGETGGVFLTSAEVRFEGRVTASAIAVHKAAGSRDEPVYPTSS